MRTACLGSFWYECMPPHSSVYAGFYPLERRCDYVVTWTYTGYWVGPHLFSVVVMDSVCSLVIQVGMPISMSKLCFWSVLWDMLYLSAPTRRGDPEYSSVLLCECALLCHLLMQFHKIHCYWNYSWPHINHGSAGNCPCHFRYWAMLNTDETLIF